MEDHEIEKRAREILDCRYPSTEFMTVRHIKALLRIIDATREERDEWRRDALDNFCCQWEALVECDISELSPDAIKVRNKLTKVVEERDALKEKLDQWECRDETGVAMAKLKQENAELNEEVEQLKKQLDRKDDRIDELKEWLARV